MKKEQVKMTQKEKSAKKQPRKLLQPPEKCTFDNYKKLSRQIMWMSLHIYF